MTLNYNPNARYDNGANAAGSNGCPQNVSPNPAYQPGLSDTVFLYPLAPGLASDGSLNYANQRVGFSAAGVSRANGGPNVAGARRSINGL